MFILDTTILVFERLCFFVFFLYSSLLLTLSKHCEIKADIKYSYTWILPKCKKHSILLSDQLKSPKNDKNIELELLSYNVYEKCNDSCHKH